MPAGDPAGYLPNVIKKRMKKAGVKTYKVRKKQQPVATIKVPPQTPSGVAKGVAPNKAAGTGGVQAPPVMRKKVANTAGPGEPGFSKRPKQYDSTKGKRRLSFKEAYARRTTDSSRARVLARYGKTAADVPKPTPLPRVTGGSSATKIRYGKTLRALKGRKRYLGRKK